MFNLTQKQKTMLLILALGCVCFLALAGSFAKSKNASRSIELEAKPELPRWEFQSIDTMKFSRDPSREFLSNPDRANEIIAKQTAEIAAVGVTHIAIATPYDDEFLPLLKKWVIAARAHNLKVWFRGNFSGWEGWFGYPKISREEHLAKTKAFIEANADLFEDGDAFSACPECENGGPGDPRQTGDVEGHRTFLLDQYAVMKAAFAKIDKKVEINFFSMNGDIAKLIMDKPTTAALGGQVTVDHYVGSVQTFLSDILEYAKLSGGRVVLGEFGAPIPDLHGEMSEEEQSKWISDAITGLIHTEQVKGLNYWTSRGGSTQLWNDDGSPRKAVSALVWAFKPPVIYGQVITSGGRPIAGVPIVVEGRTLITDASGKFATPSNGTYNKVTISEGSDYYITEEIEDKEGPVTIIVNKKSRSIFDTILNLFDNILK